MTGSRVGEDAQVDLRMPTGLYEPVVGELIDNAVRRAMAGDEHRRCVVIRATGTALTVPLAADRLASALERELAKWASAVAECEAELGELTDFDNIPAERVGDLMAWHDCVLRREHAAALLAAARNGGRTQSNGEAGGCAHASPGA